MTNLTREQIQTDLLGILQQLRDDWDLSTEITEETGLFTDLGFESIDAVALGSSLEEHYNQSLPFPEFLTRVREQKLPDVTVGLLLDFLTQNLQGSRVRRAS